tara:strand:- start:758 stop:865 length:108 start_codon:yes stop_codon:yes gene_type:complete
MGIFEYQELMGCRWAIVAGDERGHLVDDEDAGSLV